VLSTKSNYDITIEFVDPLSIPQLRRVMNAFIPNDILNSLVREPEVFLNRHCIFVFHSMTGRARTKLPASRTQHEMNKFMYGTLYPSSRQMIAASVD
jgi:hypothetical protein